MKQVLLTDVCDIRYGYAFDSALFSDSEGIPLVRIRDVVRGHSETYTTERFPEEYAVCNGDILIGMDGEFNIAKWRGGDAALNQRVCKLIPHSIKEDYLLYFMRKALKAIEDKTPFVTVKHLSAKELNKIVIPLPTEEEQRKIADTLGKLEKLISLRKKQMQKLDDLIKSRFVEMFGDINSNETKWEAKPLGELCTIVRGGSPRPIEQYLGGTIPWIKIGDATEDDNIYLKHTKDFIVETGVLKSRLIKAGSLIFANCGVSLGFARIVTFNGCIHDGWLALENIDTKLDKVFLLYSLNSMTEHFRAIAPAGTQPNLNTAIMKAYRQIVPPLDLQKEYVSFCKQLNDNRMKIQHGFDKLEQMKQALMQKYFG